MDDKETKVYVLRGNVPENILKAFDGYELTQDMLLQWFKEFVIEEIERTFNENKNS